MPVTLRTDTCGTRCFDDGGDVSVARRIINGTAAAEGFTLVELMVVLLIIGILVAVATPIFYANRAKASQRTCYGNQRTVEGTVSTWVASGTDSRDVSDLAGVVDATHPLVTDGLLVRAPRCPSAPSPADFSAPDASTGAYTFDASGTIEPCTFGELGAHGYYR